MVTYAKTSLRGYSLSFEDGTRFPASFTHQTDELQVKAFCEAATALETELRAMVRERDEKIAWNHNASRTDRRGKDWPVFKRLDRVIRDLCEAAGIRDS